MIIDFTAFGDELEKIAASAMLKRLRKGLISPEEALAASKRISGSFGPGMVGQQGLPTEITGKNLERLLKIRTKRFMKKGLSEKEAIRAAKGGIGELADIQRHGNLRTQLQTAAAKKRGASDKELKKLHYRLAKEKNVLLGESRPEVLSGGWRQNAPTAPRGKSAPETSKWMQETYGESPERADALARNVRDRLEERAARLGRKRDLSGAKAHNRILRGEARTRFVDPMVEAQRKASLEAVPKAPTAPTAAANADAELLAERGRARSARQRMQQEAIDATPPPAASPGLDPAVQARAQAADQRMAQQQQELNNLRQQTAAATTPQPTPTATPTAPAPSPTPTPTAAPPPQEQGGMSPAAIAGLGLGAAGAVGAGAYGIHRLRQRRAQQAQQGM